MPLTFPEDPEKLSESLVTSEGQWDITYPNNSIYLDRVYKKSGEACIAVKYNASSPGALGVVSALFYFNSPQDLRSYKTINFFHLLQAVINGSPAFSGKCQIVISSRMSPGYIIKLFGTTPGVYESKSWDLRKDFELGMDTKSFDGVLAEVRLISITCEIAKESVYGPFGQACFIDRIYFAKALGTLYVDSEPTGKAFTFDGRGFITPHGFKGAVGDEHIIAMVNGEFLKWENGSTSLTRTVLIPDGTATVTAYYKEVQPPQPPMPQLPIITREALIGLGIVLLSSFSLFVYSQYVKRR